MSKQLEASVLREFASTTFILIAGTALFAVFFWVIFVVLLKIGG